MKSIQYTTASIPDENVCDIYKRFKNLARIYAYNLQKILETI